MIISEAVIERSLFFSKQQETSMLLRKEQGFQPDRSPDFDIKTYFPTYVVNIQDNTKPKSDISSSLGRTLKLFSLIAELINIENYNSVFITMQLKSLL